MEFLLQHAFERVARVQRASLAWIDGDRRTTYIEADEQANQLARHLRANGVRRGDRVALFLDRSDRACVAIFGILKLGAAYLPIDPQAPPGRVEQLCNLGEVSAVIVDGRSAPKFDQITKPRSLRVICNIQTDDLSQLDSTPLANESMEDDLAYVIFTSGSTGMPKGIMHTHRSAVSYARWAASEYGLTAEDRIANFSPFHFDISTFDLFAAREAGAATVIVPQAVQMFPASCSQLLESSETSVVFSVPWVFQQLLEKGCLPDRNLSRLRWMIYGGEPFPPASLAELMRAVPTARVSNMYGPAEVNGVTCFHLSEPPTTDDPIPIGFPAANTEMLVVDENDQSVELGEAGELLVRSATRMQGYWNAPDLSDAATFVRRDPGGRKTQFHRTGDLVRQSQETGEFVFIERRDHLIKTRGYRVELGEIEARMRDCEGVSEAAAYAIRSDDTAQIHAVFTGGAPVDSLETHLRQHLPNYALPQSLRQLERLPRTSTGKADRAFLRAHHSEA
ncbi:MAG: amino acid adenylation domain-containing protein [Verrucomicrobiota bacterium]